MRMFLVLLTAIFASVSLAQQVPPPSQFSEPFKLSVDVSLVLFNVTVTDRNGRLVSGLKPENFTLIEDGQPQEINFFRAEDSPATVGLVLDNSGSMVMRRQRLIEAALTFAEAGNPQDELFLVTFNDDARLALESSTPFTNTVDALRGAFTGLRMTGQTALHDAVSMALDHLENGRHQRKALLVLSDGADNVSKMSEDDMLAKIEKANATVYTVGIYDSEDRDKNPDVLKDMAKIGGGEAHFPKHPDQLPAIWEKIAGGIRSQYTLGFESQKISSAEEYRRVTIKAVGTDGRELRVRTREGYRAPAVVQ